MARALASLASLALLLGASEARAQSDLLSAQTLHGLLDLRVATADGEASWLDGGFGKTTVSGGETKARVAEAALEWKPRISFSLSGVVTAEYQPGVRPKLDWGEAYLKYQAPPNPIGRVNLRAGVFYPPVSMEHEGVAWTTPNMLSASAINTWIGEEVKVGGLEGAFTRSLGAHEVVATAAVFGWNDTSGTLLTFRGWSLGGLKTGARGEFELPPLSPYMEERQADDTYPTWELDHRAGYYGRLEWRPPAPVSFNALYYDNAGDRVAVKDLQWAWETRFLNLGARWDVDERTRVLAQAMNGETLMGYRTPAGLWVDMGYRAAYVLGERDLGLDALSGRLDWFETNDRTLQDVDDNNETGWAVTGAWRHRLAPHADLLFEAMHVSSKRPARVLAGEGAKQSQTVLQSALRLSF